MARWYCASSWLSSSLKINDSHSLNISCFTCPPSQRRTFSVGNPSFWLIGNLKLMQSLCWTCKQLAVGQSGRNITSRGDIWERAMSRCLISCGVVYVTWWPPVRYVGKKLVSYTSSNIPFLLLSILTCNLFNLPSSIWSSRSVFNHLTSMHDALLLHLIFSYYIALFNHLYPFG